MTSPCRKKGNGKQDLKVSRACLVIESKNESNEIKRSIRGNSIEIC